MKPVYTVDLFPRENVPVAPRPALDVWEIVQLAVLGLVLYVIVWLVMSW